jgi:hypothetical protein
MWFRVFLCCLLTNNVVPCFITLLKTSTYSMKMTTQMVVEWKHEHEISWVDSTINFHFGGCSVENFYSITLSYVHH